MTGKKHMAGTMPFSDWGHRLVTGSTGWMLCWNALYRSQSGRE